MGVGRKLGAPTIRDVARLAQVSPQTVSRVLNNPEMVKKSTADAVQRSIETLGYRPSQAARMLATNRSGAIGVIDTGSEVLGQLLLVSSIESAARSADLSPRVVVTGEGTIPDFTAAFQLLRDEMIEGLIVLCNTTLHVREALRVSATIPTVLVANDEPAVTGISTVSANQRQGAADVIDHLRRYGQRMAMITGPSGWVDSDSRLQVWKENAPLPNTRLLRAGDWSSRSGFDAMLSLLDEGVDSVFACNDYMAMGAIWACVSRGLRIPEDIAICGFDDVPGVDHYNPPITTVRQPFAELGREAVRLLIDLIHGESSTSVVLPTQLVVRRTA